jgi:hypothetical protein
MAAPYAIREGHNRSGSVPVAVWFDSRAISRPNARNSGLNRGLEDGSQEVVRKEISQGQGDQEKGQKGV